MFRCWEYGQLNVYFRQLPSYHFHFFSVQTNVRGISFSEIWIFTTNTKNENKMKYPTNKTHFKRLMEKEFKTKNKIFVCIFSMKTEIEWQFSRRNAMLIVTLISLIMKLKTTSSYFSFRFVLQCRLSLRIWQVFSYLHCSFNSIFSVLTWYHLDKHHSLVYDCRDAIKQPVMKFSLRVQYTIIALLNQFHRIYRQLTHLLRR